MLFNFDTQLLDMPSSKTVRNFLILNEVITHSRYGQPLSKWEKSDALYYFTREYSDTPSKGTIERIQKIHFRGIRDYYTHLALHDKTIISSTSDFSFDCGNAADLGVEYREVESRFDSLPSNRAFGEKISSDKYDNEALRLMKIYAREIVDDFIHDDNSRGISISEVGRPVLLELLSEFCDGSLWERRCMTDSTADYLDRYLQEFFYNLVTGLRNSKKNTYYASLFHPRRKMKIEQFVDEINYISSVRLSNGVNILPAPQTLAETIEMRNSPYIKSFRSALADWSACFAEGEYRLAAKMMTDIEKANQALEKLTSYKKHKDSPYAQIGNFLGGFIPIIGQVLNVATFGSYVVERKIESENQWVLMPSVQSILNSNTEV